MNLSSRKVRVGLIALAALASISVGTPQIRQVLKVLGAGAAVKQFAPDINKAINRLSGHTDTASKTTKVVPILSIGIGKANAVGAAQVTGTKAQVAKVEAVAAPETDLFGKEIRIRALIPVSSKDVVRDIKRVDGVGITGIVDLKL